MQTKAKDISLTEPPPSCGWRSCARLGACARRRPPRPSGLTPTSAAALATIERHGPLTPSELAEIERVKRPTMTRTLGCLEREGLVERTPDPQPTAAAPWSASTPPAASACAACAAARTPTWRGACASCRPRKSRRWSGRPRSSSGCGRVSEGERRPAPLLQLAGGSQLPPLLRRPADLPLRHLDADGGRDLADPQPHRQRRRRRPHHRAAVPADAAVRRLGRPARRPHPEAAAADHHAGADGDPRGRPLRRHRDRRRRPRGWSTSPSSPSARSTRSTTRPGRAS